MVQRSKGWVKEGYTVKTTIFRKKRIDAHIIVVIL